MDYDLARQFVLGASIELGLRDFTWLWHPGSPHVPQFSQQAMTHYGVPVFLLIVAIGLLVAFGQSWLETARSAWLVRGIRAGGAKPGDAAILYQHLLKIMKKRGYEKPAWFTPREFAATVRLRAVDEFTEGYNALRYGGDAAAAERMKKILQDLS